MAAAAALLDGALSHFRAKRTAEAKAAFDDALRVCASRGGLDGDQLEMVHSMRGDCCAILGMQALAAEDFGRSIELAPDVAIYRYKRSVVLLQRQIRASVHRILETRRRLLKQYEKSEKHILVTLVRERADFVREQKEAIQGPNQGLQPRPATCTMPFSNEVSVLEEGPNFRA